MPSLIQSLYFKVLTNRLKTGMLFIPMQSCPRRLMSLHPGKGALDTAFVFLARTF